MLKFFSRIPNRDVYMNIKSPLENYFASEIEMKEIGEIIKPLNEYENAIVVFECILGTSNSKYIDQFFREGRQFIKLYIIYHNPF